MTHDPDLAAEISRVAASRAALPPESEPDADQLLAVVGALGEIAATALDLQAQAVRAAHEQGASWSRIGKDLGVSRQAVQQRFGSRPVASPGAGTRVLRGLSRVEEVAALNEAGRQGWKLAALAPGEYVLEPSSQSWEVTRASALSLRRMPSRRQGWEAVAMRFPDCFYIRPRPEAAEH
ncbi:hypothetical protein [Actinomyces oricola]|uniref:hypothetical protein n=1 Tax=Actinomyces oricola TaxID=206043 RepID=UPI000FFEA21C|nr:hypothetical protein [Actinomyces oricola]